MRTTVTLDPDVEQLLRVTMKERGVSFKEALNHAVRAGAAKERKPRAFTQRTFSMGAEETFRWEKALAAADAMEDEELVRKVSVRK
jgi:hypothetical protein